MTKLIAQFVLIAVAIAQLSVFLQATDDVAGTLFTLTTSTTAPNGAWSWFQDERAIIDASDPDNPLLLISSVSSAADGDAESGDIDLLWRNLTTGVQGEFELHNRLERDDHDSAALYLRPEGRYLALYARHGGDNFTRWRVSTAAHDPTSWGPVQTLDNGAGATYNNIHYLPDDNSRTGRTYNFTRATGFDPVVQVSSNDGTTWTKVGQLLTQGDGGDRPYVKYASDGNSIHFISTEEHPRDFANSVYHGYIRDGVLYDSVGSVIDGNLFDMNAVSPTALTRVFANGSSSNGTVMNRAWTICLELDNTGNPAGILTARANNSSSDHRFFYARFDGADWQVSEMAEAGGYLYASEADYTGLAAVDPDNPNVVFMSSKIDPRSSSTTAKYELYKGFTSDFGKTWSWTAITENSTVDNLRPIVPAWNGQDTAVAWMRGTYTTYTNWNTEVVGLRLTDDSPQALLWRGGSGIWDDAVSANWSSGGGAIDSFQQGDEVAFDDSAKIYNVHLTGEMSPMGTAFNNKLVPYTLTGAGLVGSGGLRIFGGSTVTLANDSNSYTGETLVAKGALALMGVAALSGTSHIRVRSQATIDVTGLTSGCLTLSGQQLTVEGDVVGNVLASNGSSVTAKSGGHFDGTILLSNSWLTGTGVVRGDLSAAAGAVVRIGGSGISVQSTLGLATYYDATAGEAGNTTLATGETFNPPLNGTTGVDNAWEQRTPLGSHGSIFESGGEAIENAPPLRTTIAGLDPEKAYQIAVLFWDATGSVEDWNIRAGLDSRQLTFLANGATSDAMELGARGADLASSVSYAVAPTTFTEANRVLLAGVIGEAFPSSDGAIQVFLDDMPSPIGANNRTWYDGLAVREVLLPTHLVIGLNIEGDYVQHTGASMQLDIYSPTILDRLSVSGNFLAAGTLVVSLAVGAPSPQLGDSFQIITAAAFVGSFDSYELPVLDEGLAWNVSKLAKSGVLEVVPDIDLDHDGDVDGRDFLILQRLKPDLVSDWQQLYGDRLVVPPVSAAVAVPEPPACCLMGIVSVATALLRSHMMPAIMP